jgi:uncharacterized protein YdaU (DUF1376 family)
MATPIDSTRFDFHVVRFMESETIQKMTDAEVGQYVLLLCKAWLGNKNASLPNDPKLLNIYARTEAVTDLVMSKWTAGPDGRLYNERLSEEWTAMMGRSTEARRRAEIRWNGKQSKSNAPAVPEHEASNSSAMPRTETDSDPENRESEGRTTETDEGGGNGDKMASLLFRLLGKPKTMEDSQAEWAGQADEFFKTQDPTYVAAVCKFCLRDGPPETVKFWLTRTYNMEHIIDHFDSMAAKYEKEKLIAAVPDKKSTGSHAGTGFFSKVKKS